LILLRFYDRILLRNRREKSKEPFLPEEERIMRIMRESILKIVCVALILLAGGEELFATDVGGLICTNTTWTAAGSPYIVIGSSGIVIGCNATLTIEPGVVVKFNPTLAIVVGYPGFGKGTLVARGTAESPIIFTSIKDPCDPCTPAAPGDWSRIHFTDYSIDAVYNPDGNYVSGCILEHVIVEYAGYGNWTSIFAEKSSPFLNYCEVRHNSYYGIQVDGTNAPAMKITNSEVWDHPQCGIVISGGTGGNKLLNNNIHDNRGGGIYFASAGSNTLIGNTISNNTGAGINFSSSGSNTLRGNTISNNTGRGIYFDSSAGNTLSNTLTGNTITGNTGGGIYFGSSGSNTLTGNTITGNASNRDGGGIFFGGDYGSGGNTLTGNIISGNMSTICGGGIYFGGASGSNTLTGNTITDNTSISAGGGIYGSSGSNTLTGNTICGNKSGNAGGGIYGSGSNTLTVNTITGNTSRYEGGGICFSQSGGNTLTGNTISGNTSNTAGGGICFYGWGSSSGSNTLTGNTISYNTSSGAGGGICFYGWGSSSGSNTLTRNVVQSNISKNGFGAVHLDTSGDTIFSQNTITDNYIETGTTGGIYVTGNSERVSLAGDPDAHTYNIIQDNDGYWVYNNNTFNADGRNDVNAIYVQWGTSDVLLIMEKIFDYFDDGSKAFVLFYPFVIPGDFDFDEDVDLLDLKTFVDNWLRQDCWIPDWCEGADLDVNTKVDFFDFARFAEQWLEGTGH
jgi:parallel beta-helix repeat protein